MNPYQTVIDECNKLIVEFKPMSDEHSTLVVQLDCLRNENIDLKAELERAKEFYQLALQVDGLKADIKNQNITLALVRTERDHLKAEIERLKRELDECCGEKSGAIMALKGLENRHHELKLLAESYKAIIRKLLMYGRERPDAYDTYYEAEAEARAALNGNEK